MYRLCHQILGPDHGDFRPADKSREEYLSLVRRSVKPQLPANVRQVIAPRSTFSSVVVDCEQPGAIESWDDWFSRSVDPADGALIEGANKAVAILNGDCPIVCLWQGDKLAVLHAGYRCLIREEPAEPNLLDVALKAFAPGRVQAWIGYGIGACCWIPGYGTKPEILDPSLHPEAETIRACLAFTTDASPGGAGHVSIDLSLLAKTLLIRSGVPASNITVDGRCTCCWRENGRPVCWSLTRAKTLGEHDGRNFSVAWLEEA